MVFISVKKNFLDVVGKGWAPGVVLPGSRGEQQIEPTPPASPDLTTDKYTIKLKDTTTDIAVSVFEIQSNLDC